jgi:hypothetical protein
MERRTATGTAAAAVTAVRTGAVAAVAAVRNGAAAVTAAVRNGTADLEHALPVPFPRGSGNGENRNGQEQYGGKTFHGAKITFANRFYPIAAGQIFRSAADCHTVRGTGLCIRGIPPFVRGMYKTILCTVSFFISIL